MTAIARWRLCLVMMIVGLGLAAAPAAAQSGGIDSLSRRVRAVERDVDNVESRVSGVQSEVASLRSQLAEFRDYSARNYSDEGLLLFFVGVFCALWAQNTRRNPWLWFFLGFFFHAITLLFLLAKNARDRRSLPPPFATADHPSSQGW